MITDNAIDRIAIASAALPAAGRHSRAHGDLHAHILSRRTGALAELPAERSAAATFFIATQAASKRRAGDAFPRGDIVPHSLCGAVVNAQRFAGRTQRRLLCTGRRLGRLRLRRGLGRRGLFLLCWRSRRTQEPGSLRTSSPYAAVCRAIRYCSRDRLPARLIAGGRATRVGNRADGLRAVSIGPLRAGNRREEYRDR